mmetsp:Transcript_68697/g.212395  ORF Transcript_68697/g.212395 Transcript_68697/m.212395 type:complete len:312 (-) Transcript_68697:274-1209(-)
MSRLFPASSRQVVPPQSDILSANPCSRTPSLLVLLALRLGALVRRPIKHPAKGEQPLPLRAVALRAGGLLVHSWDRGVKLAVVHEIGACVLGLEAEGPEGVVHGLELVEDVHDELLQYPPDLTEHQMDEAREQDDDVEVHEEVRHHRLQQAHLPEDDPRGAGHHDDSEEEVDHGPGAAAARPVAGAAAVEHVAEALLRLDVALPAAAAPEIVAVGVRGVSVVAVAKAVGAKHDITHEGHDDNAARHDRGGLHPVAAGLGELLGHRGVAARQRHQGGGCGEVMPQPDVLRAQPLVLGTEPCVLPTQPLALLP